MTAHPVELLELVPEVETHIIEEMKTKVFIPVQEITDRSRGAIKKVIEENAVLFTTARKMFAVQGRRVPVEGQPSWNEWLKQNLPCSDRYVRKILADIGAEMSDTEPDSDDESPLQDAFDALSPFFGENARCPLNTLPIALAWIKQNQPTTDEVETLSAIVHALEDISKFTAKHHGLFAAILRSKQKGIAA